MKTSLQNIQSIVWKTFPNWKILFLAIVTAVEFAQSFRIALLLYLNNKDLQKMAEGEILTNNLDHDHTEDHVDFLVRNSEKHPGILDNITGKDFLAAIKYLSAVSKMTPQDRAMTIFAREKDLPAIFENILKNNFTKGFDFYEKYLRDHIRLDTEDGGHGDLVDEFPVEQEVADRYYDIRYQLYKDVLGL